MQGVHPRPRALGAGGLEFTPQSIVVTSLAALLAVLSPFVLAHSPILSLIIVLGAGIVFAVCLHPPIAAYVLLATTPLIVGMDRGFVIPLLRPSEAVLAVLALALVLRAGYDMARGSIARRLRFNRLDASLVFLAATGSVVPLLWLLARGKNITKEDVFWSLQLWKYYGVFLVVRFSVRTEPQVRNCLWITMIACSIVSLIAILQSLQLFGVPGLLTSYYGQDSHFATDQRGTSTVASSLAVGDMMVVSLAIAATWLLRGARQRRTLLFLAGMFVLGVMAAGQFSGYIAFLVAVVVVGLMTGSLGRYIASLAPVVAIGSVALWPVIGKRLSGFDEETGLPHSWVGRLTNLKTFFWPRLDHFNWVLGVRPAGRVPAPEKWRDWVYIESGHTWLLWTGGVPFFLAFWVFVWVAGRRLLAAARRGVDAIGVAGVAGLTSLTVIVVLMTFDPHLTLRGEAELFFSLLALGLTGTRERAEGKSEGPGVTRLMLAGALPGRRRR